MAQHINSSTINFACFIAVAVAAVIAFVIVIVFVIAFVFALVFAAAIEFNRCLRQIIFDYFVYLIFSDLILYLCICCMDSLIYTFYLFV